MGGEPQFSIGYENFSAISSLETSVMQVDGSLDKVVLAKIKRLGVRESRPF